MGEIAAIVAAVAIRMSLDLLFVSAVPRGSARARPLYGAPSLGGAPRGRGTLADSSVRPLARFQALDRHVKAPLETFEFRLRVPFGAAAFRAHQRNGKGDGADATEDPTHRLKLPGVAHPSPQMRHKPVVNTRVVAPLGCPATFVQVSGHRTIRRGQD
jgi:hypothetical protein